MQHSNNKINAEHGHGDVNKLYLFIGVAVLILILACLNYLILASSNAMKREKSIWIRKVQGASAGNIITQAIFESAARITYGWFSNLKSQQSDAYIFTEISLIGKS
jgi:hypothetical protein